jgi:hypothetical protein
VASPPTPPHARLRPKYTIPAFICSRLVRRHLLGPSSSATPHARPSAPSPAPTSAPSPAPVTCSTACAHRLRHLLPHRASIQGVITCSRRDLVRRRPHLPGLASRWTQRIRGPQGQGGAAPLLLLRAMVSSMCWHLRHSVRPLHLIRNKYSLQIPHGTYCGLWYFFISLMPPTFSNFGFWKACSREQYI